MTSDDHNRREAWVSKVSIDVLMHGEHETRKLRDYERLIVVAAMEAEAHHWEAEAHHWEALILARFPDGCPWCETTENWLDGITCRECGNCPFDQAEANVQGELNLLKVRYTKLVKAAEELAKWIFSEDDPMPPGMEAAQTLAEDINRVRRALEELDKPKENEDE
ncbi:MAG: hypothetical protein GY926_19580 [bacterium]|nr:hypothetical protein [bacterium]